MSVSCKYCGAVAGHGHELGHKSDCPVITGAKVIEKLTDLKQDWKHYKKKPVVIKATELTEDKVAIQTREGLLYGYKGDFIIQGIQGEIYPCGREIFFKTYEEVNQDE